MIQSKGHLQRKIDSFLERKGHQYPELSPDTFEGQLITPVAAERNCFAP